MLPRCGPDADVQLLLRNREEDADVIHGHITSLAVKKTYRKLGLATRLMRASRAGCWSFVFAAAAALELRSGAASCLRESGGGCAARG